MCEEDKASWLAIRPGPKYINVLDSQLWKSPFPTFSQFVSALKKYELWIHSYEEDKCIDHNLAFVGLEEGEWDMGCGHGWGGSTWPTNFNSQGCSFIPLVSVTGI